jgi:hypothetical protein
MEPESSLPYSHAPVISPYPEPHASSPHPAILFLQESKNKVILVL